MKTRQVLQKIVAIGGGSIGLGDVPPQVTGISREIVRLSGKKNPRLLFIPTASSDDPDYIEAVQRHFGDRIGCRVHILFLVQKNLSKNDIQRKIKDADIIYVGGGNTLFMMGLWKRMGIDRLLRQAHRNGKVLCGSSAGAICWFRQGNSDSRKYKNPKAPLIKVTGLGFINALVCPHYDVEKDRAPQLEAMMKRAAGMAVALDNCAALEVVGDKARVILSSPKANGYKVYWKSGEYFRQKLERNRWMKLSELLHKG